MIELVLGIWETGRGTETMTFLRRLWLAFRFHEWPWNVPKMVAQMKLVPPTQEDIEWARKVIREGE